MTADSEGAEVTSNVVIELSDLEDELPVSANHRRLHVCFLTHVDRPILKQQYRMCHTVLGDSQPQSTRLPLDAQQRAIKLDLTIKHPDDHLLSTPANISTLKKVKTMTKNWTLKLFSSLMVTGALLDEICAIVWKSNPKHAREYVAGSQL